MLTVTHKDTLMTKLSLKTVPESLLKLKEALEMGKKPSASADQSKKTKSITPSDVYDDES